jgi:hypothetical protein
MCLKKGLHEQKMLLQQYDSHNVNESNKTKSLLYQFFTSVLPSGVCHIKYPRITLALTRIQQVLSHLVLPLQLESSLMYNRRSLDYLHYEIVACSKGLLCCCCTGVRSLQTMH